MIQTVPEFYRGQKILVTGGTGFMGKVLIEKLLRSCPDVDTIYVIIRSKKGKSIEERWKDITSLPLFDKLKSIQPENLTKVKLVPGELSRDDLGISDEDKQILRENVTMTFHIAADIQFTENINDALVQNVKATKVFLDFLTTFNQLKAIVYLSTAYCNFNRPPSESVEEVIPACQDWKVLLKIQETEPASLQLLKEKLLCGHPNPYTWSKSLAEQIVNEYSTYVPTVIMRPAIVVGCFNEDPIRGWSDALNGLSALILGTYTGVLRIICTNEDCYFDFVPVDIATRAQLIAAKKAAEERNNLEVYNCATSGISTFTVREMKVYGEKVERNYPIPQKIWATSYLLTTNPYLYFIMFFFRQVLPAVFLDLCLKIAGKKEIFKKIAIRAANAKRLLGKFSSMQIQFPIGNYNKLEKYLCEEDKTNFSIDVFKFLDAKEDLFVDMSTGLFKYYLKEDLSAESILRNRKRVDRILLFRKVVKTVQYSIYGFFLWNFIKYWAEHITSF